MTALKINALCAKRRNGTRCSARVSKLHLASSIKSSSHNPPHSAASASSSWGAAHRDGGGGGDGDGQLASHVGNHQQVVQAVSSPLVATPAVHHFVSAATFVSHAMRKT